MHTYAEIYAEDIDGNHGIPVVTLVFDDSPEEITEIKEKVLDKIYDDGELPFRERVDIDIEVGDAMFEDIEIELDDYFNKEELEEIQKELDKMLEGGDDED